MGFVNQIWHVFCASAWVSENSNFLLVATCHKGLKVQKRTSTLQIAVFLSLSGGETIFLVETYERVMPIIHVSFFRVTQLLSGY